MRRICIAIVDAARARLFTYQELEDASPELAEVTDLVNEGRRMRPYDRFSDSGGSQLPGHPGHSFDDHRDKHVDALDVAFARTIVTEVDRIVKDGAYGHVIVVASPKMLGDLRKLDGVLRRKGLVPTKLGAICPN